MTTRIYYTEPSRREFDATVTFVEPLGDEGGRLRVRLDRTAFYPSSGGQPHDTGTLGRARVVEVADNEQDGDVDHLVMGELRAGERVEGVIDWSRRADHMQQHTGQHVLSAAFDHLCQARTVSFHLGTSASTIDLSRELTAADIGRVEDEANRVVLENRPVSIRFVTEEEASRLPLRKEPARGGRLRLIEIEGFDLSACGGTHVSRTGEIGIVAVSGWERFKGGMRVEFLCGGRTHAAWRRHRDTVAACVRLVSTLPHELPSGIERLQAENKDLRRTIRELSQRLAGFEADALASRATVAGNRHTVVEAVEGYDASGLKTLALGVATRPRHVAVLFSTTSPALVTAACNSDTNVDCSQLVRALFERFGGRGGGKPEIAQGGGLDAPAGDLVAAARAMLDL